MLTTPETSIVNGGIRRYVIAPAITITTTAKPMTLSRTLVLFLTEARRRVADIITGYAYPLAGVF